MDSTHLETTINPTIVAPITITFSWYDYIIFCTMLGVSVIIGVYFGCFGSKQSTASEYLMGGKKMHIFPIVMSLVASHISGVTLLGVPADVYKYGASYWLWVISTPIMSTISVIFYTPVLYNAQITSVYEYLEKRFDRRTRMLSSFLFAVAQLFLLPIVIYVPALAFAAATGINLHLITPVICGICIFYTTIGGLKAVVWTDTIQFTVTLGAVATVLTLGVRAAGGFGNVWAKAIEGHRLDIFDFDVDVIRSDNFWAPAVGLTFLWIAMNNTNQGCVQKILSLSTLRDAKIATFSYAFGMALVKSASVITGLIIYAKYSNCDPFTSHQIKRKDQLLPYYVLDVAGNIPGLAGLFIAGVFSAGLSTLSAHLNCMSGTIYEDFVSKFVSKDISEQKKSNILKLLVVLCGITCTALVLVFERLGGILPLAISFAGVTAGPMLGMFTLGILFRRANCKGAFYGGVSVLVLLTCLAIPAKYLESQGIIHLPEKPISVEGCTRFNFTISTKPHMEPSSNFFIFRISYYYYTLLGSVLTVVFGLLVSYFTEEDARIVDEELLSPFVRRSNECEKNATLAHYSTVEKALHVVVDNSEKNCT